MVDWALAYTKRAEKDSRKLASANLREKAETLLASIQANPFAIPPPFEKLIGDLNGLYSRRINVQHRLVYEVRTNERTLVIHAMFTHYQ